MEIPDALVPELEPSLIAFHLALDDPYVCLGCHPRVRVQLGYIPIDSIEDSALEVQEIGIDAHPMAGVFPVSRFNLLTLQRSRGWGFWDAMHVRKMWHPGLVAVSKIRSLAALQMLRHLPDESGALL
jgi:hypothetical protein